MKKFVMGAFIMLLSLPALAQEKVKATLQADFVSQYVWRGQFFGHAAVQPTLGIGWRGLSVSAWGNAGLVDTADPREVDLAVSYTLGGFSLGVTDYWVADDKPYFTFSPSTAHVVEATLGYDFGFASLSWSTNLAGCDGLNPAGNRAYSSYLEAKAPFSLGGVDWEAALGIVPYATDYYGVNGFQVVNLALSASWPLVETERFSLPLSAQLVVNPAAGQTYFVAGLSFALR